MLLFGFISLLISKKKNK
nr:hypothetical protein [Yersinia intermedia]